MFECCFQGLVVLLLGLTKDQNIVAKVYCSWDSGKGFADDILKNVCRAGYTKAKTGVSPKTEMGAKGCDVLDSGVNSTELYPWLRSSLLNTVAPFRALIISLIVGVRCLSRCMALSACLISTHTLTLPGSRLGATTMGDTQGVGPLTRSITPCCSSFSS